MYVCHSHGHKQYRLNSCHVFTSAPAVCREGTQDESIDYLRSTKGLFCHMYYLTHSLLLNAILICINTYVIPENTPLILASLRHCISKSKGQSKSRFAKCSTKSFRQQEIKSTQKCILFCCLGTTFCILKRTSWCKGYLVG